MSENFDQQFQLLKAIIETFRDEIHKKIDSLIQEQKHSHETNRVSIKELYEDRNNLRLELVQQKNDIKDNLRDINNLGKKCDEERQELRKEYDYKIDRLKDDIQAILNVRKNILVNIWKIVQPVIVAVLLALTGYLLVKVGLK